ncbi:MAG: ABC transporter permease, partial [Oscillospiraceae bacterium]|nr:ABC transporter permease [Oscillospiraceae bacterium]
MFIKDMLTVAKKELRSAFSDKAILLQIIILPFVIVFGYSMLMSVTASVPSETTRADVTAYSVNSPDYMSEGLDMLSVIPAEPEETDSIKEKIKNKECELLIVFPENFKIADEQTQELSDIEIWYNTENNNSLMLREELLSYLDSYRSTPFTINADPGNTYDLGDEYFIIRKMLGTVLPMLILMAVFMVCMNLAANSIAGDKEQGFLATMLITPVKRSSIAAGKSLCIFTSAVIGGISAFAGMAISLPRLAEAMGAGSAMTYSFTEYAMLFIVSITANFALTGVLLIISALSKNVKQATTISPVFMIFLMAAGMLTMMDSVSIIVEDLGIINAFIPAWNTMIVMQDITKLDYSASYVLITCVSNILFSFISI